MRAPIYFPEGVRVPDAVLKREQELLERDGPLHVGDRYFAREADAALQRRWQAELEVRAESRTERLAPRVCAFCEWPIEEGEEAIVVGGAEFHSPHCSMGAWESSASYPTDADFAEADYPDQAAA